mmetsp:Transcript_20362/g.54435  ORF Transcript_20362/g.54435 Transcript_20362/m.54435 type:complete len:203 (-) Transcript_20362:514-1122(-)
MAFGDDRPEIPNEIGHELIVDFRVVFHAHRVQHTAQAVERLFQATLQQHHHLKPPLRSCRHRLPPRAPKQRFQLRHTTLHELYPAPRLVLLHDATISRTVHVDEVGPHLLQLRDEILGHGVGTLQGKKRGPAEATTGKREAWHAERKDGNPGADDGGKRILEVHPRRVQAEAHIVLLKVRVGVQEIHPTVHNVAEEEHSEVD